MKISKRLDYFAWNYTIDKFDFSGLNSTGYLVICGLMTYSATKQWKLWMVVTSLHTIKMIHEKKQGACLITWWWIPKPLFYLKSEIKSASLNIWKDNWDNGETGRSTHDIVPRVSNKPVGWRVGITDGQ
ncbi:hypothetical protein AVEN_84370-1 [Araneus ventricosus]|uniref:Uncharacterized protein n=1 Tax=Araneus ventricosus TaxID=182803 RepID=A0A4Y2HS63_ARAVE|nr:hypothetical protein AVEN_84370-1 [Araneus ventricosus]